VNAADWLPTWRYDPARTYAYRQIDGDTFVAVLGLPVGVRSDESLRLARYDAPERGEPGWAEATAALWSLVTGSPLALSLPPLYVGTFKERRTFTRYVAEVWIDPAGDGNLLNVSDLMIAGGHGVGVARGEERW